VTEAGSDVTAAVVLVRPWASVHGGAGCCSGDARDGICFDGRVDGPRHHDHEVDAVAATYLRLRAELPDVDVQIVSVNNSAYLLPRVFRAVRRRRGLLAAMRETNRATTAGSVLVDGERVGDVATLGPDGVAEEVRRRVDRVSR
jgi:hypothetical protein